MAGVRKLRKLQLGQEAPAGTAVAASSIWRGVGTIKDDRAVTIRTEDVGFLGPIDSSYVPTLGATLEMEDTEVTFEQSGYVYLGAIDGSATGASDGGGGSGKIWTFSAAAATQKTPLTYTIEGGDNEQAEEMEYAHVTKFSLSGKPKEAIKISATWTGRQVVTSTYTSLALAAVEDVLFGKSVLSIDAVTAVIGTTAITSSLIGFDLSWVTGFIPVWTANGFIYFDFVKQVAPEVILKVTFEHNSSAVAQKAAWRAKTPKLLQIKTVGSALTTAGTVYTYKTHIIKLAGIWTDFDKIGEADGNDIVTGTFTACYNSDSTRFAEIVVVNELATMP